jgi:hypothetical protein
MMAENQRVAFETTATELLARAGAAVDAGVAFLSRTQLPDGELPTMRWPRSDPEDPRRDRTVFGTALGVIAIAGVRGAETIVARAADSIESQTLRFGIWKYSPDYGGGFPPISTTRPWPPSPSAWPDGRCRTTPTHFSPIATAMACSSPGGVTMTGRTPCSSRLATAGVLRELDADSPELESPNGESNADGE